MPLHKPELKRRYDLTAYMYDQRYGEIQRKKYQVLAKNLPRANRALDVGCGTGMFLSLLSQKAKFIVGIDMSAEMLQIARKRAAGAALVQADADNLPFADGSFDVIVSVTLLQNMPDPAFTVREFARVLRPAGIAMMTSLKHKHSPQQLMAWTTAANLKPLKAWEMQNGEDVICIARREG
ncbi:MAG: class I SAM-dependent methyltransferase [Candidatus Hodarchaeaceae archaeon]|nr:class I SAM-dependent methyltransferase [Candidatus Hodarchaeaceae archaeon]